MASKKIKKSRTIKEITIEFRLIPLKFYLKIVFK
nr:MAG TPA: hypothetical protein [Caudoviricetes sp.]